MALGTYSSQKMRSWRMSQNRIAITKAKMERVLRMYKTAAQAARALGVSVGTIDKRCDDYGLENIYRKQARTK